MILNQKKSLCFIVMTVKLLSGSLAQAVLPFPLEQELNKYAPEVTKIASEEAQIQKMKEVISKILNGNRPLKLEHRRVLEHVSRNLKEGFEIPVRRGLEQDITYSLLEKFPPKHPCCSCDRPGELKCPKGHSICKECLKTHINDKLPAPNKETAETITKQGFPCQNCEAVTGRHGTVVTEYCDGKLSLEGTRKLLAGTKELKRFEEMLSASSPSCQQSHQESAAAAAASAAPQVGPLDEKKVTELREKIEQAFNLCCPTCKGVLDAIEGCNAATCTSCNSKFCYLCLNPEADSQAAHAHARAHSGNYWELRDGHTGLVPGPGEKYQEVTTYNVMEMNPTTGKMEKKTKEIPYRYQDRYHWEIVRQKLETILHNEKDQVVKERALVQALKTLKENKMWPLPIGKSTDAWINDVRDSELNQKNKISLLQNELVYQSERAKDGPTAEEKAEHQSRSETLKAALLSLNAPVLTSLDVGKGQMPTGTENITPILGEGELARLPAGFVSLGRENVYRVRDPREPHHELIWSHVAPRTMNHADAIKFCQDLGARLPTKEEYEALARAMSPGGRYNPELLPETLGRGFWSSSLHPVHADYAFLFSGNWGDVGIGSRSNDYSVRCVAAAN